MGEHTAGEWANDPFTETDSQSSDAGCNDASSHPPLTPNSARWRWFLMLGLDAFAWVATLAAATAVRLSIAGGSVQWDALAALAVAAVAVMVLLRQLPHLHTSRSRRGSISDVRATTIVWSAVSLVVLVLNYSVLGRPAPTAAIVLALPLALLLMLGSRIVWRVVYESYRRPDLDSDRQRVIVFGAGEGGEQIIRAMLRDPQSEYVPVAVLDDHRSNATLHGVPCRGGRADMAKVARQYDAAVLLIAIPSAGSEIISALDDEARAAGLSVRVLPSTSELLGLMTVDLEDIRELTETDLLGRSEVEIDLDSIRRYVTNKRVLVTGAGGSIGSELCRQLHALRPSELFMLDRDETALHSLQLSIEGRALLDTPNLIVADIRDAKRIDEIFAEHRFDVVFHTAALKHLTLLENHPEEAIKTNVLGTKNLLDAAIGAGVSRFVNVSTDKAADPTSMLGASKLLAERLTANTAETSHVPYLSVRFGNVLGSRGSVLPTFREQIARGGPVTVTHRDVTRFFMTIPEAVRLVLQAGAIGDPGEILILDMGEPVRINDLAERLIEQSGKRINIHYPGLRPGEKLHETLVAHDEIGTVRSHPRITHTKGSLSLDISKDVQLSERATQLIQEYRNSLTGRSR